MSRLLHDQISGLLSDHVRYKANRIKSLSRYSKKPPEVMVKISGHCYTADHTQSHFDYISRNGKLEIEDECGQIYQDKQSLHLLAQDWEEPQTNHQRRTRHSTHIVLSMPDGTEPKAVKKAVREFAKKTFSHNHQYVMALHTDTDSPHVHLTVKNLGFDGKRLHVRKGLPQIWRERFAKEMERQGVAAEATAPIVKSSLQRTSRYHQIQSQNNKEEYEVG
ncbi:relaxase/mobilization nuclease domain-containing protein [Parashewanella tropica]|uniref:relaxase/mobilization nuclease domain-containing protein n=1 Tax=Parashewanella tropica TaxID=2547970 RepID=UPI001059E7A1|nr:relaxase/mobilization nuclease domain-containing protein [Parashewanella tropica]